MEPVDIVQKPHKVAVLSRSFSAHPVLRAELADAYPQSKFNDAGRTLAGAELIEFVKGHDGVIVALERIDDDALSQMTDLRIISKYGVGLDNVDLAAAAGRGIRVGWKGGVNRRSVSELALSMMIGLVHRVPQATSEVRAGTWRQLKGRELGACTVGVLGCGHVGKLVIKLLNAIGARVLAHDIQDFSEYYAEHSVESVGLDELLSRADVVTLHLPFTSATKNMLNAERLDLMPRGAMIVNTARGGIIDEQALKARLADGRLGGAALDVLAQEPPSDPELLSLPTIIVTPHIGGSAEEAVLAMGRSAIAGLSAATSALEHIPIWLRS